VIRAVSALVLYVFMSLWRVEGKINVFTETRNNKKLWLILGGNVRMYYGING